MADMVRLVMVCTSSGTVGIEVSKYIISSSGDSFTIILGGGHGKSAGLNCCTCCFPETQPKDAV